MVTVKVLFEYVAEREDELSLKEGEIVENVLQQEGGWWTGTLNGKTGMFPDNFVEVIATKAKAPPSKPPPPKAAAPPPSAAAPAPAPAPVAAAPAPVAAAPAPAPAPVPARPAAPKKKKAKCLFDYEPTQDDELGLKVGDVIVVLRDDVDGWCEGELNGKQGVFPSNFVEMLPEDHDDHPPAASASEPEEPQQKKVHGVGFGNIFQGGMPTLKKTVVPPPTAAKDRPESNFVAPQLRATIKRPPGAPASSSSVAPPPVPASSKPVDPRPLYKVLFEYSAVNEDELSLKPGQLVRIVKKEDGGWWQGDLDGKVGWFPDNYVEPAPEEEKKEEKKEEPAPAATERRALVPPGKAAPPPLPGGKPKGEEPPPPLPAKAKDEPAAAPPPPLPARKEEPPAPAAPPKAAAPEPVLPRTASTAKAVPEPPSKPVKPAAPPAKPKQPTKDDDHKDDSAPSSAVSAAPPAALERTLSNPLAQLKKVDSQAGRVEPAGPKNDTSKDLVSPGPGSAASEAKIAELTDLTKAMREELDKMKKQVAMLTSELDDEKAARSKMQIEIDRIKKSLQ